MSYNDDKRELLKLKQGLIEESETIKELPHEENINYEVKGFGKKVANFFYLYKIQIVLITFFAALAVFLTYSLLSREQADMRVLVFAESPDTTATLFYRINDFENALEQYTPNYDENGYTHVEVFSMNLNPQQDTNYYMANQAKLFGELKSGVAQLYIADRSSLETIIGEQKESQAFVDLSALYPDDPNVTDNYYYKVKGSTFADALMYLESCPEDLYIVLRSSDFQGVSPYDDKMEENNRRALEVFDNIVNDRKVTAEPQK